jgi:hypothetical protein
LTPLSFSVKMTFRSISLWLVLCNGPSALDILILQYMSWQCPLSEHLHIMDTWNE